MTSKRPHYLQLSLLCLLSSSVYLNTLRNDFVYDDIPQVLQNPWIRDFANIPAIFKNGVWAFRGDISNYYRPVMHLIYLLGYQVFGPSPWGFHLINMLLNTAACILVFAITGRLLRDSGADNGVVSLAPFFTAAVFAVHPVHTEAVAWVAGVTDLSYTVFYLLSLYFYMVSRGGEGWSRLAAIVSVASFLVALLCKEPAATLPALLFGYDYAVKRCTDGPAGYIKRYLPYAAVLAVYLVIRQAALGGFSPNPPRMKLGWYQAAINIPPLFSQYLKKLLFPFDLNVSYLFHPLKSLLDPAVLLGVAVSAGFVLALFLALRSRSSTSVGLLLIAAPLLPALYIPGVGKDVFSERYLYLPVFGFALLAGLQYERARVRMPGLKKVLGVIAVTVISVYSIWTITSNKVWANDVTLWSHSVKVNPGNPYAHTALGEAYNDSGLVDKAIEEYKAAIVLDHESSIPHLGLSIAYEKKGMLDDAIKEGEAALSLVEGYGHLLALTHSALGAAYARKGQLDKAEDELVHALRIDPGIPEAHGRLGAVYNEKGQLDMAVEELGLAIRLDPTVPDAHSNLGIIYGMQGDMEQAVEQCELAVQMAPDSIEFHDNLGIAYSMAGDNEGALEQFLLVLRMNPLYPKAHYNLGVTYLKLGRMNMAAEQFEGALKLDPDNSLLRENLKRARSGTR